MGSAANLGFKGHKIQANSVFQEFHPPSPMIMEDMLFDVLADTPYVTVAQSGTPLTAAAINGSAGDPVAGHGGWLAGSTDDVDAEIDEISIGGLGTGAGTPFLVPSAVGDGLVICEWGITVPGALTTRQYFAGLSDDPVEGTGTNGSLNIQSTTTITDVATDAAGWIFSSLATNPTVWKYGATKNGTQDTAADGTDSFATQVANTWVGLRVEIDSSGNAFMSLRKTRGGQIGDVYKSANGVTSTVALVPIFTAAPTTTAGVAWEIDYCFCIAAAR